MAETQEVVSICWPDSRADDDSLAVRRRLQRTESSTLEEKQAFAKPPSWVISRVPRDSMNKECFIQLFFFVVFRSQMLRIPQSSLPTLCCHLSQKMEAVTCWHVASVVKLFHWPTSSPSSSTNRAGAAQPVPSLRSTLLPLRPIGRSDSAKERRWRRVMWSSGVWRTGDWRKSQVWGWRPTELVSSRC